MKKMLVALPLVFLLLVLMFVAAAFAFAAVLLRALSNRVEQTMLAWTSVNDGLGDLRRGSGRGSGRGGDWCLGGGRGAPVCT